MKESKTRSFFFLFDAPIRIILWKECSKIPERAFLFDPPVAQVNP